MPLIERHHAITGLTAQTAVADSKYALTKVINRVVSMNSLIHRIEHSSSVYLINPVYIAH
ncbi:MAG: hypothetical protein OS130_01780 [Thermodesulfobacteriota bacterium]|jgi:hypothetical protein|nr:MAG: hypothetical protein OS130_01780 [Thermodesulfobacteriota bacterium]